MAASQGSQGSSPASGGDKKRDGGRAPRRPAARRPVPTPAEVFPHGRRPPRRPEPAEPARPEGSPRGTGEGGSGREEEPGKGRRPTAAPGGNGGEPGEGGADGDNPA